MWAWGIAGLVVVAVVGATLVGARSRGSSVSSGSAEAAQSPLGRRSVPGGRAPVVPASAAAGAGGPASAPAGPSAASTTDPAPPRPNPRPVLSGLASPAPTWAAGAAATHVEGTGSGRVAVTKPAPGAVVARLRHGGAGDFAVHRLDASGRRTDLLVGTVGAYQGSRLFDADGAETSQLEIRADGTWSIELVALPGAPAWSGRDPAGGEGDTVLVVPGGLTHFTVAQVTHGGYRSFSVSAYTATSRDLVVSAVGPHAGRHALAAGVLVLAVTADGPWSITPR